jgi:hypothetical protein
MPHYLDNNIWQGVGSTSQDAGEAFTRAIVGTQALRYQQAQMQQQQAMEAARLEMERQKLLTELPRLRAETDEYKSNTALNRQKLSTANETTAAGKLANQALQARQMVLNPGQGGDFKLTPELSAVLPAGQYDQNDLANRLLGLITGAGAQASLQAPSSAVSSMAQAAYMQQSPEGLRNVAIGGYPPNSVQRPTPQQVGAQRMAEAILDSMLKGRKTDFGGQEEPDYGEASAFGNRVIGSIYGDSNPSLPVPNVAPAPPAQPRPIATPQAAQQTEGIGPMLKRIFFGGGAPANSSAPALMPAPAQQSAGTQGAAAAPPPQQRQHGQMVKTAKGTFAWNAQTQSWDPVQPPQQ